MCPRGERNERTAQTGGLPSSLRPYDAPAVEAEGADQNNGSGQADRTREAGRARRRGRSSFRLAGRIIATLLSITALVVSGYVWATYHHFSAGVTRIDAIVPRGSAGSAGQPGVGGRPVLDIDGMDQNILLVGDDHRPQNASPALLKLLNASPDATSLNTDTMIVLHVPADGSRATMISFPRDSWVDIPGFGMNKLNSAFNFGRQNGGGDAGGARLLIQVIQNMTGLTIDHFVRVSMLGFYQIAEVLGPVQVCLNQATQDYYSGTNLPAGVSTLDAQQALSFVRQRHGLPGGDLDREVRQQYLLSAEFRKVASAGTLLNPFKLDALLNAVSSNLETDPGLDLLKFAEQMQHLQAGNLKAATIPITGTPTIYPNGVETSIVSVDFAALPGFIATVIGHPSPYQRATAVRPATVTVSVLNAGAASDAAATNTAMLDRLGFRTTPPGSSDATSTTTAIEYPAGMEAQAKTLAGFIPGVLVTQSAAVHGVTLLLGTDGINVTAPGTALPWRTGAAPSHSASANPGVSASGSTTSRPVAPPSSSRPVAPPSTVTTANTPARSYGQNDCIN